jgi:hypothetical protein
MLINNLNFLGANKEFVLQRMRCEVRQSKAVEKSYLFGWAEALTEYTQNGPNLSFRRGPTIG